ncbi:MAG: hypothetical protein IMY86_04130 [Chloroflexi bacterium]|nr:hypothetical protein [Chloroflexota bacterium]
MIRRFLVRLVALALLLAAYFSLDWVLLRRLLRSCAAFTLRRLGHCTASVDNGSELLLVVDSEPYAMTANCTYADLFLAVAPFCWRAELRPAGNLRRLVALALAIFFGNVVRTSLTLHLTAKGVPWALAHTVPDKLIHTAAVGGSAIVAVRGDWEAAADG